MSLYVDTSFMLSRRLLMSRTGNGLATRNNFHHAVGREGAFVLIYRSTYWWNYCRPREIGQTGGPASARMSVPVSCCVGSSGCKVRRGDRSPFVGVRYFFLKTPSSVCILDDRLLRRNTHVLCVENESRATKTKQRCSTELASAVRRDPGKL